MRFRHFRLKDDVRIAVNTRIQPWHRYHGFLSIIRERYEAETRRYDPHPPPGVRVYHVTEDVHQRLQLEVETFYLYANMMLDQIAVNIRFFFGFSHGKKTKLHPNGEDWSHLTILEKLEGCVSNKAVRRRSRYRSSGGRVQKVADVSKHVHHSLECE